MTDPAAIPDIPDPSAPPAPPRKKGRPLLAWVVILAVVGFLVYRAAVPHLSALTAGSGAEESRNELTLELLGRTTVGAGDLYPALRKQVYGEVQELNTGPLDERLRFVCLVGELRGPDEALQQLDALQEKVKDGKVRGSPEDRAMLDTLKLVYRDYAHKQYTAPSVPEAAREQLRQRLGWFGQLALAPPEDPDTQQRAAAVAPAHRTFAAAIAAEVVVLGLGMIGFTGLCLYLVLLLSGQLRSGITPPFLYGGVYAETFAVWIVLFLLLQRGAAVVPAGHFHLLLALAAFFLSLLALAWPVLRGVPWRQVRQDIGWTAGRTPPLEPVLGIATWIMAIPLLFVGVLLTFALIHLQKYLRGGGFTEHLSPTDMPTHPITQVVSGASGWVWLQLVLLASVAAPIIEETMFRGVLYRHLREATGRWGRVLTILCSGIVVSFFFAVIHPQGWTAIPALMALAFAFCLMREWRGTLLPCMVAHGLHNGLVMLLLYFLVGNGG